MKNTVLAITLIILSLFQINCKAQTTSDYISFYNDVVPKLNSIVPYKTQFYGQNFSMFYSELQNKNIAVMKLGYDTKIQPSNKYYVLYLFLENNGMWSLATDNTYQYPWIAITFQDEIPATVKSMVLQYHGQWNTTFLQFFSNLKIENIKFVGVRGYDNNDFSGK
jgi:hypothetical protein